MNYMIYSDLESLLIPYQSCDNKNAITVELNKHEVSGYSINVVSNHTKNQNKPFTEERTMFLDFVKRFVKQLKNYLILE